MTKKYKMKSKLIYGIGLAGILLLCTRLVFADADYSIGYHETVNDLLVTQSRVNDDGTPITTISMFAFDQELVLELEPHDELTSSIETDSNERGATSLISEDVEVLRGKVLGTEGSWVRLTRTGSFYTGVIWNGDRLLALEPYSGVNEMLTNPDADDTDHVIYDTDDLIPMKGQSCAVDGGSSRYGNLVNELQTTQANTALQQLDVAFLTDGQFAGANPDGVNAAVISRLNIIDGIFSEQVGVKINATSVRQVGDNAGLTSTNAGNLLGQLRTFGNEKVSNPGLVHLFTGRDLDGGTVGIAYVNVLCSNGAGYGITQANRNNSVVGSALTASHEFGHNFGAPHDNQSGSSCESTPGDFLMNAFLNGSSTFSQCSLDRMAPAVSNAACLVPISTPDPEPAPNPVILSARFNKENSRGFTFVNNPWGLGNRPKYQIPRYRQKSGVTGGALSILFGGIDEQNVNNMSGGYRRTFNLPSSADLTISFKALLRQSPNYEPGEVSVLYASFNGKFLRANGKDALATIKGDGDGGPTRSTGFKTYRFALNDVPAGQQEIIIGGFNNKKTDQSERTEIRIDDVKIEIRQNQLAAVARKQKP